MTSTEIRTTVRTLQAQGHSLREISRTLALSRNTVRRILRTPAGSVAETPPCDEATLGKLKAAFERARGNVVRVRELLADDGFEVSYSTLTRWVREADLRGPPRRAGEYTFVPGQEMQHDTSPHRVTFVPAGKPVTVQCAGMVLAYSRRLFIQYYPRFTRFESKAFLLDAVRFMAGVCPVCTIDNTSVLLAAGASGSARIGWETRNARAGSSVRSRMLKRISWPGATLRTSMI
jgi:transposase